MQPIKETVRGQSCFEVNFETVFILSIQECSSDRWADDCGGKQHPGMEILTTIEPNMNFFLMKVNLFTGMGEKLAEMHILNCIETCFQSEGKRYVEICKIVRRGDAQDVGHYVAYVKRMHTWYLCDDGDVRASTAIEAPYMILYANEELVPDAAPLPPPKGINNYGNTCFFNSSMQLIKQIYLYTNKQDPYTKLGRSDVENILATVQKMKMERETSIFPFFI